MILTQLHIIQFKNIREADLLFADKINCFIGLNGQGKTNLLDAIYYLSFTKSAFSPIDSQNICHQEDFAMIQGRYHYVDAPLQQEEEQITCGLKRGQKKHFRRGKKDYKRLLDHIGLIPLVMVSPADQELILEGSDARRKFIDGVISQYNKPYLEQLTCYNDLLKQRNALLKQLDPENGSARLEDYEGVLDILEQQMTAYAESIFAERSAFINRFLPIFQELYTYISGGNENVSLTYVSQLQNRSLIDAYRQTRARDIILGWTSQGIHKDELEMRLDDYAIKQVGSQGQQKTYLLALKLAQALFLAAQTEQEAGQMDASSRQEAEQTGQEAGQHEELPIQGKHVKPILLLDDIFDKLDAERVSRIVSLVHSDRFGQIFLTDTDRQHISDLLLPFTENSQIFHVSNGCITPTR